nr:monoacylglycerol lipase ABHD6-like [Ipomoea trifida]
MVNLVEALLPLLNGVMKMEGVKPHTFEIEPGTVLKFWVPKETIKKPKKAAAATATKHKPNKPAVVLIHGFAGDGILTWPFQVAALTKKYSVYVPDILFFGGSITDSKDRSPAFQAECLSKGLRMLGVEKCTVVGFSYGGMVAFKMAEMFPQLVEAVVVSGAALAVTDSLRTAMLHSLRVSSFSDLLMPNSVKGLKKLLRIATYKKYWFPNRIYQDFLKGMFSSSKEREELLEGMVESSKDNTIRDIPQKVLLLWGENDEIFKIEQAKDLKDQLGSKTTLEGIRKAGHLVHLERPCVYNRCLKKFLASLPVDMPQK